MNIYIDVSTHIHTHTHARAMSESESHSVVSYSLQLHGQYSPWNSPGQNTGVGSHSLLQEIFLAQGLNWCPCVSCIQADSLSSEPPEKPL